MSDEQQQEVEEIKISDFRPYLNRFKVTFKVIEKDEVTEVQNRNNPDETHNMCNVKIADATGSVILTAWDDDIEYLEVDNYYNLTNGYVNLYRDSMRLARGKYGEFSESDAEFEANTEVNRSDEKHERRQRRRTNNFSNRSSDSNYTY